MKINLICLVTGNVIMITHKYQLYEKENKKNKDKFNYLK